MPLPLARLRIVDIQDRDGIVGARDCINCQTEVEWIWRCDHMYEFVFPGKIHAWATF